MCTVSFVVSNKKIIITSNRDEKVIRPAIEPKNYLINNKKISFPKDPKAGGTWYAIDENANVLVLLNGAEEKHIVKSPYRKSRGLIVLDIISNNSSILAWNEIDLINIEPFTLVLFYNQELYQLRWNGINKETTHLNNSKNYIWSSATLYDKENRANRSTWFYNYLDTKQSVNEVEMLDFHRYTEKNNSENGLVINRNETMKTLSITQTVIEKNKVVMIYSDLINQNEFANTFLIT